MDSLRKVALRRGLHGLGHTVLLQLHAVDQHAPALGRPDGHRARLPQQQLHLVQLPVGLTVLRPTVGQGESGHTFAPRLYDIPPSAGQPGGGLHQGHLLAGGQLLHGPDKALPVPIDARIQPGQVIDPAPVRRGKEVGKYLLAGVLGLGSLKPGEPGAQKAEADIAETGQQRQDDCQQHLIKQADFSRLHHPSSSAGRTIKKVGIRRGSSWSRETLFTYRACPSPSRSSITVEEPPSRLQAFTAPNSTITSIMSA